MDSKNTQYLSLFPLRESPRSQAVRLRGFLVGLSELSVSAQSVVDSLRVSVAEQG